jgi:hypothetical protein
MSDTPPKFDPAIQSEDIAFRDEELVPCRKCGRKNSPERLTCLYCAAPLESGMAATKLNFRKLESWENGQNVVVVGSAGKVEELASLLSLSAASLEMVLASGIPVPVARVSSLAEAQKIIESLSEKSFEAVIVSDSDLDPTHPPRRLGGLEFNGVNLGLIDFNTHRVQQVAASDVVCIIKGTIIAGKTDTLEKRKRGKPKTILEESSMISDEVFVDLYTGQDSTGYRIHNSGFDFSCLGKDKGMLASENIRRLIRVLMNVSVNSKVVMEYDEFTEFLSDVWPIQVRKEHQGLVRTGIGKREFGMTELSSNAEQFTKFSRLQWYVHEAKGK